jgi:hypothetical protein
MIYAIFYWLWRYRTNVYFQTLELSLSAMSLCMFLSVLSLCGVVHAVYSQLATRARLYWSTRVSRVSFPIYIHITVPCTRKCWSLSECLSKYSNLFARGIHIPLSHSPKIAVDSFFDTRLIIRLGSPMSCEVSILCPFL